jgi:hypothetical protein
VRRDAQTTVVIVRDGAEVASWRLVQQDRPALAVVDELARLHVAARRLGCTVRVRNAWAELLELLDLAGLRGQVGGETEGREEGGVHEVVVPDDPVA